MARSLEDLQRDEFLAEAEHLAQLISHPAWERYETLLAKMRLDVLELTATARNPRNVARYQGAAAILQELMERPHQITAAAQQIRDDEARAKAQPKRPDFLPPIALEDDL